MDITLDYIPSAKQTLAHESPTTWTMFGGAEFGGKTRWLVQEILRLMLVHPGIEGLLCRFDYSDLVSPTQARDQFYKICPEQLIRKDYSSPPAWVQLKNGSRLQFMGLKDHNPSSSYGFCGIDQAEEVPEETIRLIRGRIRQWLGTPLQPHYRMMLTCNPHPNIEWYRKACDQYPDSFRFIVSLPQDNPTFTEDFITERKIAYTEDQYRRLIEGSWDVFSGQALPEYNRDVHVIEPFEDWRKDWPVWRGIDWGLSSPTVCLWLTQDHDGNYFFCQEYEQKDETPDGNARAIAAMSAGIIVSGSWIDPRTAQVRDNRKQRSQFDTPDDGWSVYKEFIRQGVYCQLAQGKRENRLAVWKKALKILPDRRHFQTMQPGAPQLYIMKNCERLIYELPRLKYRAALQGFNDDILKQDDHAYDAGGFVLSHVMDKQSYGAYKSTGKFMIGKR